MNRTVLIAPVLLAVFVLLGPLSPNCQADEGPLESAQPKGLSSDQIIQHFASKEKEFKQARELYTFRQDVKVQTLDGSTVRGEYHEVFDVTYDDQGKHLENVVFAPASTLDQDPSGIILSPEDLQDFRHRLPFVLTSDEIPEYDILYMGQQQEDELHCYVFDVAPKKIEGKKRYFQGRIWVDDRDFQIVKTFGKTVPDIRKGNNENLFPKFTTWREQVDGNYWFPVFTKADDILHFKLNDVHIREIIKYSDYRRFGTKSKITYEGREVEKTEQQGQTPPPANTPPVEPPK
ncbi:MAG TPA: hypothetical protein VH079_14950 [Terriglobales bacterium]|jgi:hypothetical protein|nr:hypothetical protein [Terriglobales bacterium]